MSGPATMIRARGLTRSFGTGVTATEAVRGVDLDVQAGEIVGFLGPNGAGKTTTLRMLTTLLRPTRGEAAVAGFDLATQAGAVRQRIGYVAQGQTTDIKCTVIEELLDAAALYRLPRDAGRSRAAQLVRELHLDGLEDRRIGTLSGGQRRRLEIAIGLVHRPPLLFLDEPTTGLDPQSRANLWEHVRRVREEHGTTVFVTTHYLDEADALCDRLLILDHGRIIAEGTADALKRQMGTTTVRARLVTADLARVDEALRGLDAAPDTTVTRRGDAIELVSPDPDAAVRDLVLACDRGGVAVRDLRIDHASLDDVFLTLTGRSLREGAAA